MMRAILSNIMCHLTLITTALVLLVMFQPYLSSSYSVKQSHHRGPLFYQLTLSRKYSFASSSILQMSDENPSDMDPPNALIDENSSGYSPATSPAPNSIPAVAQMAKDILLSNDLSSMWNPDIRNSDSSSFSRIEINEYVLQLEKSSPIDNPAYSEALNGVWELLCAGFGSPAVIAYQILKGFRSESVESDLTLTISSVQPRVMASTTVKTGPLRLDVSIATDIEAVSSNRIKETFVSARVNSFEFPLPANMNLPLGTRELLITYLDDDLLICRDYLGSPEILRRKV